MKTMNILTLYYYICELKERLTFEQIMQLLNVSTRTVYRYIAELDAQLALLRPGYQICFCTNYKRYFIGKENHI